MLNYEHSDLIMEAKCPYPNEDQLPVHYNIPVQYVPHVLSGMRAKRVHTCLYVSHSKQSTTFLKCKYDKETWKKMELCKRNI